jgi:MFS family permease
MARRWWTLTLVCVAAFMLLLDITIVNVAVPEIQSDLGASLSSLQWVIDAYALTLAAFLPASRSRAPASRPGGDRARVARTSS